MANLKNPAVGSDQTLEVWIYTFKTQALDENFGLSDNIES